MRLTGQQMVDLQNRLQLVREGIVIPTGKDYLHDLDLVLAELKSLRDIRQSLLNRVDDLVTINEGLIAKLDIVQQPLEVGGNGTNGTDRIADRWRSTVQSEEG